jgi:hypothetical protein
VETAQFASMPQLATRVATAAQGASIQKIVTLVCVWKVSVLPKNAMGARDISIPLTRSNRSVTLPRLGMEKSETCVNDEVIAAETFTGFV